MFPRTLLSCAVSTILFIMLPDARAQTGSSSTWSSSPFAPPAIPLAVRHPYLSCWLSPGNASLSQTWPTFWNGQILGWAGYVRVDGTAFRFMGQSPGGEVANQTSVIFTPTRSTFQFLAGPVTVTADFISPIEPDDLSKQSMPFSYLAVSVTSLDGAPHTIQVYSDISAEWISGNSSQAAQWSTVTTNSSIVHQIQLQNSIPFSDIGDRSQGYTSYHATSAGGGVTFQTGQDQVVRSQFVTNGVLQNIEDTSFRAINANFPVFAFSSDLGNIVNSSSPTVFVVGFAPGGTDGAAVEYIQPDSSLQERWLYFMSQLDTMTALQSFLSDFSNASGRSSTLDGKIASDAGQLSNANYADLLALSARQAMGSLQITISKDENGNFNTSDVMVFMKEISSSGRINTMDVIYPLSPILLYLNPNLLRYTLEPTLQYMGSGQYPSPFVPHDLGEYPIASGSNANTPNQPVEESGNMLIMSLAAARLSGDGSALNNHYDTLKGAADYLVANTVVPNTQSSTDDFLGQQANTSNLALKGIIAVKAMGEIRSALNMTDENSSYSNTATSFIQQWMSLAISPDGSTMLSSYNNQSSFAMAYNLFADRLLGTSLVPDSVYEITQNYVTTFAQKFGVTLDSRQPNNSKSDWMMFTAAALNDQTTRDNMISLVNAYASAGAATVPFSDYYNIINGQHVSFQARPVQGAMFSLLALSQPAQNITIPPQPSGSSTTITTPPSTTSTSTPKGSAGRLELSSVLLSCAAVAPLLLALV